MTRVAVVLVCLAFACAAPNSGTYNQGVPVAPRPAPFNPALDAPHTIGQPGYVGPIEGLPRSPHGRVLPEDEHTRREPGIWSAKEPKAALDMDLVLVDVPFPFPAAPTEEERKIARQCVVMGKFFMGLAIDPRVPDDITKYLLSIPAKEYGCIVARAHQGCLKLLAVEESLKPTPDLAAIERIKKLSNSMDMFAKNVCRRSLSKRATDLIKGIQDGYNSSTRPVH